MYYSKQSPSAVRVPQNYSGNAFRPIDGDGTYHESNGSPSPSVDTFIASESEKILRNASPSAENTDPAEHHRQTAAHSQHGDAHTAAATSQEQAPTSLFAGIGTEELLLIGLILLLHHESDDSIALLMLLIILLAG